MIANTLRARKFALLTCPGTAICLLKSKGEILALKHKVARAHDDEPNLASLRIRIVQGPLPRKLLMRYLNNAILTRHHLRENVEYSLYI